MDKKIILSVLIVALIGIVAATYQINVGNDLLNPLANVQPEEDTPVTEALSAPAASTSGDSANTPGSNQQSQQQSNAQSQQQAQSQAQQQAQSTQQAQQAQAQQNTNNNQGSSSSSQGTSTNSQGSSSSSSSSQSSSNSSSSSSQNSSSTNSSSSSNAVVKSVSEARQYALARMEDSGMSLGNGYRDTDRNGKLVYVFPVYNHNNENIGNMYIYPDGEMQVPDVSRDVVSSVSDARQYALARMQDSGMSLGSGYETTDHYGKLVYVFPVYNHNNKNMGNMYIYPDGEIQAPDVSYQN